ncbi:uncharacterized protein EV420DRAFT_896602 [Desarmillaria tabescens]|uniref:NAD(P)-binding protein n=1 Tax=Armillaria tabescens TaxID=1929756 RepID=A0AA39JPJ4_ARMTA|nr:uncharacterized protein EV420DRAFT_896602 [Desarmillaria tabescens]KAK0446571.1 hypothetical protein EV420DRAFT_896602 [Desarmillaria tabescens]
MSSLGAKTNSAVPIGCLAYGPTKSALEKLTFVLGTSFAQRDIPIQVNAMEPGIFPSEMATPEFLDTIETEPLPGFVAPMPARRHGSDAELGMTAIYLTVSDYTNGAVLSVDGRIMLVNP